VVGRERISSRLHTVPLALLSQRRQGQFAWRRWETELDAPKDEPQDRYTYFPENPVASPEGEDYGNDQRYIERRDDVLVYTSDLLRKPLEIMGKVFVHLSAATDAKDTDFTARLLDVYPDGRAFKLGPEAVGVIRARYRNGRDHTELLSPGQTVHYQIELYDIGHTFLPGHQIRVEISSSFAPWISPNANTGNPVATDMESKPARQTIFHDRKATTYISLPVQLEMNDGSAKLAP